MKFLFYCILITFVQNSFSKEVILNEMYFQQLDESKIPTIQKINAQLEGSELNLNLMEDVFQPNLNFNLLYGEDKSRQLNQFVPVTSPTKAGILGISKNSSLGLSFSANLFANQFTNNFLRRSTTVGTEFNLGIDLYKDIFGRTTRKKYNNLKDELEMRKLEAKIFTHQFKLNLYKMYWGLVANNEAILITKRLINQAKKQVEVTIEKVNNSVSDKGTLARTRSILSSREGSLNSLEYQKSNLLRSFKELIPELSDSEIKLDNYNLEETIKNLFSCTGQLQQYQFFPKDLTLFDEMAQYQVAMAKREKELANIHNDVDLKLNLTGQLNGKDFSYNEGFQNFKDDSRWVTKVGVLLSVPLGGQKTKTAENLISLAKRKEIVSEQSVRGKLSSYHSEILQSIVVLQNAIKNQHDNTMALRESLISSRQKFNQARITIEQLVGEEDAYFSSELTNIQTNLSILHTLLDYFSVFTETKCPLNI